MNARLDSLQVVRALAAGAVLWEHALNEATAAVGATPWLGAGPWRGLGAFGVDLFFVISGFIITRSLRNGGEAASPATFLRARIARVAPIYFLISLPCAAAAIGRDGFSLGPFLATFLFWPVDGSHLATPYLQVGWTLCFEMLFYLAAALVVSVRHRGLAIAGLLLAFAVASGLKEAGVDGPVRFIGNPLIVEFLLGAGLAALPYRLAPRSAIAAGLAVALAVGLLCGGVLVGLGDAPLFQHVLNGGAALRRLLLWAPPALLLVATAAALPDWRAANPVFRAIVKMGDASYALYLFHYSVLGLFSGAYGLWGGSPIVPDVFALGAFGAALLAAQVIHRRLELPVYGCARRLLAPRPPLAVAAAT